MRFGTMLLVLTVSMITQSCRIESPFFVNIVASQVVYGYTLGEGPSPFKLQSSIALRMQNGFKDTLIIGDDSGTRHGVRMRNVMHNNVGIPLKNLVFFSKFGYIDWDVGTRENRGLRLLTSGRYEMLRKATRVVHVPKFTPFESSHNVPRIRENTILFVVGVGNMIGSFNEDRDMYNINHVVWNDRGLGPYYTPRENYKDVLEAYNTGKVIAATSALITDAGTVKPYKEVVSCGDIKESCFTVLESFYTSSASAHLAGISFYLAQFWETPEEIVDVLKSCAIDIGEPGVDREFGQGAVNLWCPRVLKKEVEMVSEYLGNTGERGETLQGGNLEGLWRADSTTLQVYIPRSLKETTRAEYQGGTVNGTVEFAGGMATADFTARGVIKAGFLMLTRPIEATAEDVIRFEEAYTVDQEKIAAGDQSFSYTATRDSLHLVRTFSLNEALSLLPDPLGSMVDMASPDFFADDPIQLRMSFLREKSFLLGDFNEDGRVDTADFLLFVDTFGSSRGDISFDETMDLVPDGIINVADFIIFIDQFGKTA